MPSLFRFGLSLSQQLDRRFGRKTIAAKMTDVPGHTRAIVPLLADAGVQFLHIGVNPASTPPYVPPLFVWREPGGAQVTVMYHREYGATARVNGLNDALAICFTGDNKGPQAPRQVRDIFAELRPQFPGAHVQASTLDEFARKLQGVAARLPVVTQEIGDTWIHGVGTDPAKVRQFRELLRLRNAWLTQPVPPRRQQAMANFSRTLLLIPEHTWGMDEKSHLPDHRHFSPADLAACRKHPAFRRFERSWAEQRLPARRRRGARRHALGHRGPRIPPPFAPHSAQPPGHGRAAMTPPCPLRAGISPSPSIPPPAPSVP